MNVSIYGGGITGLTIAHELATKGFKVSVYEKDLQIGGMAKSKRNKMNTPTEHSWRGYAPFYYNAFDILKRIPIDEKCQEENIEQLTNTYSKQEIEKHNKEDSLWTYYKNDVYDITDWVKKHPGGRIVIKAGGKDLEKVWKDMGFEWHMTHKGVLKALEKYKIGTLKIESLENNATVYDNLSQKKISFYLLNDRTYNTIDISLFDYPYLTYIFLKGFLSNKRKSSYFKKLFLPYLKDKVSNDTYDYLVNFVSGPGFGFDINTISYGHYTSFIQRQLESNNQSWYVMAKPTSEAWFNEWIKYLEMLGVKFYLNTELKKLMHRNGKVIYSELLDKNNNKKITIDGGEHCICINPYNAIDIFKQSEMNTLYELHKSLETINNQIGFIIAFKEKIHFPQRNYGFVIIDSPYNITFYPQDHHWCNSVNLGQDVKSLWSGTCIMPYKDGGLTKNIDEFKTSILDQFFNSQHLIKMIKENNIGMDFSKSMVLLIDIYDEWEYKDGMIESSNKKWVNNIMNEEFRPVAKTEYENMYIGGAHCKTSINIWSMESAVESGKLVSNEILNKYSKEQCYIHNHDSNAIIKLLAHMDDILYNMNLPNILDIIIVVIITWIILKKND